MLRAMTALFAILLPTVIGEAPDAGNEAPKLIETTGTFTVPEDKISLEYVLLRPEGQGKLPGVVVTHPDPRLGGSFDSHVVTALVRRLAGSGYVTLKFNFRGVGRSEGGFAEGVGERRDVQAALEHLKSVPQVDAKQLYLAGYSFGSAVALEAALRNKEVRAYAGIGYPNDCFKHTEVSKLPNPSVPVLVVGGTEDPWCKVAALGPVFRSAKLKATVTPVNGADHFFRRPGDLGAAVELVTKFFQSVRVEKVVAP